MDNKPPYTITEKAADYLAKIVETVTRLEFGTGFKRDIKLHRENRLRTIHSSLAIEGNSLSLDEVTSIIQGKVVAGRQEEIKEVKNAYEAYDKIMTFDPYSVGDFLEAHKLMTQGLVNESGRFRSGDVGVFDGGKAIHIGEKHQVQHQEKHQVELSGIQLAVLKTLENKSLSRKEIFAVIRMNGDSRSYRRNIEPLLTSGLIEMTVPGKPNSRLQKYRLTDSGRAVIRVGSL